MSEQIFLVLALIGVANLIGLVLLWFHLDRGASSIRGLADRITRVEERINNGLTPVEVRVIHERLANIDGRLVTTNDLMKTIQEHLLENEK